jgi:hypothetical protein
MQVGKFKPMPQKLMELDGVMIKQKFDLMEFVTGCEFPNEYYAYMRAGTKGKCGPKLFSWKEKSNCYERTCMKGSCKPFRMKVKNQK